MLAFSSCLLSPFIWQKSNICNFIRQATNIGRIGMISSARICYQESFAWSESFPLMPLLEICLSPRTFFSPGTLLTRLELPVSNPGKGPEPRNPSRILSWRVSTDCTRCASVWLVSQTPTFRRRRWRQAVHCCTAGLGEMLLQKMSWKMSLRGMGRSQEEMGTPNAVDTSCRASAQDGVSRPLQNDCLFH